MKLIRFLCLLALCVHSFSYGANDCQFSLIRLKKRAWAWRKNSNPAYGQIYEDIVSCRGQLCSISGFGEGVSFTAYLKTSQDAKTIKLTVDNLHTTADRKKAAQKGTKTINVKLLNVFSAVADGLSQHLSKNPQIDHVVIEAVPVVSPHMAKTLRQFGLKAPWLGRGIGLLCEEGSLACVAISMPSVWNLLTTGEIQPGIANLVYAFLAYPQRKYKNIVLRMKIDAADLRNP